MVKTEKKTQKKRRAPSADLWCAAHDRAAHLKLARAENAVEKAQTKLNVTRKECLQRKEREMVKQAQAQARTENKQATRVRRNAKAREQRMAKKVTEEA